MTTFSLGISITDHEGKIVRKNARYDALVGGSQPIPIGVKPYEVCKGWFKNFEQLLQLKDWPAMQAIAKGRPVLGVEIDVQRLDGSFGTIWESAKPIVDILGRVAGATVITQDITRQILQERALFELLLTGIQKNTEFHDLVKSIPQLVWTVSATGTVEYFNNYVQQYQGFQREEDGHWHWEDAVHPEDLAETYGRINNWLETGTAFKMQYRLRMADGMYRWHESLTAPIRDKFGRISKWLGIARDIHEQKIIEQALNHNKNYSDRSW